MVGRARPGSEKILRGRAAMAFLLTGHFVKPKLGRARTLH
jgi:hypothetical protein